MTFVGTLLLPFFGLVDGLAGEVIPFTSEKLPALEPGKTYRLTVRPTPKAKAVFIDFHTKDLPEDGTVFVEQITQSTGGKLPWSSDLPTTIEVEAEDFNLDGSVDLRVLASWGTGGSWYDYFRWNGKRYVLWEEPKDLGLNSFDLKAREASASGRAGPSRSVTKYRIQAGKFLKFESRIFDEARSQRKLVSKEIPDDEYVLIVEEHEGGKFKRRRVERGEMGELSGRY